MLQAKRRAIRARLKVSYVVQSNPYPLLHNAKLVLSDFAWVSCISRGATASTLVFLSFMGACGRVGFPENMVCCMTNNYSPWVWRSWQRSYNLWIVRYLYVPLGGMHQLVATSVLIFTFVAIWHDLRPRILRWGWLAALFILPEVMARRALLPSILRQWCVRHDPIPIRSPAG
jgi:D-alanyl-lipoteichoic acid acyltransferase DltB (MBOAT superfamily)